MKKLTRDERRKLERRAERNTRLTQSSVPAGLTDILDIEADATEDEISLVVDEVGRFNEANAAYRGSNRFYYAALAKVYEVWLKIDSWSPESRAEFFYQLNGGKSKVTKRGGDLHVLLRVLIHHSGDERAEQRLRTRDAGALRQVARLGLSPSQLLRRFEDGVTGLDQLYRDDIDARRAAKAAKEPEVKTLPPTSKSQRAISDNVSASSTEEGDDQHRDVVWTTGLNRAALIKSTPRQHDAWILATVDPFENKIRLRRAYLTEYASLDSKQLRDAVKVLKEAGLSKRRVGRPPSKV